ncbi:uncharacterized protein N7515_000921 [Penicillium bovifimosum]|uniref:Uncharacterized protein n=1 Tax=Penicillium bovifimosum TaxID=126998 RepID=A0A9W9HJ63_9EURO|nr:uncharacterized protein N7515_000921 [Penicillium bovifimosum]KAJ5146357.1 hypothetical protein N7515_000921 [Penicillium bovifimosum]
MKATARFSTLRKKKFRPGDLQRHADIGEIADVERRTITHSHEEDWFFLADALDFCRAFEQGSDPYDTLQSLQETVTPTVLGQGSFCGRRALFLSIVDGMTLCEAAEADIDEKRIELLLGEALYALWECKAEYKDENPCNFLVCHDRIVITDLEAVEFYAENPCWERSVNSGNGLPVEQILIHVALEH